MSWLSFPFCRWSCLDDGGAVSKFNDGVGAVRGYAVMGKQGEKHGDVYTPLGGPDAASQGAGGGVVSLHHLWPVRQSGIQTLSFVTSSERTRMQ